MSKIAIIDMGTNTFHLLVAECESSACRIVSSTHEAVKIGMAGINEGLINESACDRAVAAMQKFRRVIDENGVSETYAFGTSALRNARNGAALAKKIESITGIAVQVISGDEEADLIFAGIKAALDLGKKVSLVMDIGAGSVEFIMGNKDQVFWKQSFEIGGQRLLEKFQKHDPITRDEISALDSFFQDILQPLLVAFRRFDPRILIGSSGTFDTLSEIFCIRQQIPYNPKSPRTALSMSAFYEIYDELITKDREQRMNIPGMIALRVDMIVVACCLIRFVLDQQSFDGIRVSTYSLKEGALARICGKVISSQ
jgi:exopolyphosphatase / guanosine-5'-triphosphate,3'-diphosphate pyrophosphatase